MKAPRVIDWSQIIFDLEAAGLTQREIGARCGFGDTRGVGTGRVWANNLKNIPGTQPKFNDGAMLLAVWADVTGRAASEAPRGDDKIRRRPGLVGDTPIDLAVEAVRA